MPHVGDLDGTHERILGDGITGGAVDGVDLAADVCSDGVIVLTGKGLYFLLLVGYLIGETCKVDLGSGKSFFILCLSIFKAAQSVGVRIICLVILIVCSVERISVRDELIVDILLLPCEGVVL